MIAEIPVQAARCLAVSCQGLGDPWVLPEGREGAARIIDRLGYVQIDTISVVQRAHHHVIWSRHPGYEPRMVDELLKDRRVFEFWAHAASYLPMSDYRFTIPHMMAFARRPSRQAWMRDNEKLVRTVLGRIREEGALSSSDFKTPKGSRGTWWNWKPAKRALEMLLATGDLMVSERRNFQRVYDLTERVLPPHVDTTMPTDIELGRFVVRRVLSAHGISTTWPMRRWTSIKYIDEAIREMLAEDEITRVRVEGSKKDYFALMEVLDAMPGAKVPRRVHILSPFDSMVIWRNRVKDLFAFDYSLECYRRAQERVHGYFCLPLLWGDRFIGRLDSKADRRSGILRLVSLEFEEGLGGYGEFLPQLVGKIMEFARFNECEEIQLRDVKPNSMRTRVYDEIEEQNR